MSAILILIIIAVLLNGTLAGGSLDTAIVKLPARKRIGSRAYAAFARGNDLGNGAIVYPIWAVCAALLVFAATAIAYAARSSGPLLPLSVASTASIIHFIATSRAAPVMLSLRSAPDDEAVLEGKLDTFARWHSVRMAFQVIAFAALLWALVAAR